MNTSAVYDVTMGASELKAPIYIWRQLFRVHRAHHQMTTSQSQGNDVAHVSGRAGLAGVMLLGVWRAWTAVLAIAALRRVVMR